MSDLPARSILDEVQRVPELFPSLKAAIDRRRSAGRFILAGSANVLFVPRLAESLAGRMGILRLHPLAQCEIENHKPGKRFRSGVVLYDGSATVDYGDGFFAVPLRSLWEGK